MREGEKRNREDSERKGWSKTVSDVFEAARRLLGNRKAIFQEELGAKAGVLGRALAALFLAASFASLSLLLFTAWIAALFTRLLGGPVLGILAAFLLYLIVAAVAGVLGGKALSRVRPLDFPVTTGEIRKDWLAFKQSVSPESGPPGEELEPAPPGAAAPAADDLEARFRVGSE